MYMLEQIGYAGVMTTSEYASLLQALMPEVFERASLHHLAASGVSGLIARAIKRLAQVGVKYGGPIARTIRDVRQGTYENSRPLIPGIGPKVEALINNVTHRASTSITPLRSLIPGYTPPKPAPKIRTDRIVNGGENYSVSRDFVVVETHESANVARVLTLKISDVEPITGTYSKLKILKKGVETGRHLILQGFRSLLEEDSIDLDLRSNFREGITEEVFAARVRMAELIGVLPDTPHVYISNNSSVGIQGLSYAFAFEAAFFGYPQTILYSGDASPAYQWCPAFPMELADMRVKEKAA